MTPIKGNKLKSPLILSIIVHVIVLIVLAYGAWKTVEIIDGAGSGASIEATIVDKNLVEQYKKQQKKESQSAQARRDAAAQAHRDEIQQATEAAELRMKMVEQERMEAEKRAAEEAKKVALEKQRLIEEKKRAEEAAEKARLEAEKLKAEAAKKEAIEKAKKEEAERIKKEQIQNSKHVDNVLDEILSSHDTASSKSSGSSANANVYVGLVKQAIQSKFYNPNHMYRGKTCLLKISIDAEGRLLNVSSNGGDAKLCNEAIKTANSIKYPKPTPEEYPVVKDMLVEFTPE